MSLRSSSYGVHNMQHAPNHTPICAMGEGPKHADRSHLADGVVATGEVVSGILLAGDQLLCEAPNSTHNCLCVADLTSSVEDFDIAISHINAASHMQACCGGRKRTRMEQLAVCTGPDLVNDSGLHQHTVSCQQHEHPFGER